MRKVVEGIAVSRTKTDEVAVARAKRSTANWMKQRMRALEAIKDDDDPELVDEWIQDSLAQLARLNK